MGPRAGRNQRTHRPGGKQPRSQEEAHLFRSNCIGQWGKVPPLGDVEPRLPQSLHQGIFPCLRGTPNLIPPGVAGRAKSSGNLRHRAIHEAHDLEATTIPYPTLDSSPGPPRPPSHASAPTVCTARGVLYIAGVVPLQTTRATVYKHLARPRPEICARGSLRTSPLAGTGGGSSWDGRAGMHHPRQAAEHVRHMSYMCLGGGRCWMRLGGCPTERLKVAPTRRPEVGSRGLSKCSPQMGAHGSEFDEHRRFRRGCLRHNLFLGSGAGLAERPDRPGALQIGFAAESCAGSAKVRQDPSRERPLPAPNSERPLLRTSDRPHATPKSASSRERPGQTPQTHPK